MTGEINTEREMQPTTKETSLVPRVEAVCCGDARQMGRTQGECLRAKIHQALSVLTELEAFRLLKPRWMTRRFFRAMAERKAGRFLDRGLTGVLPDTRERLLGMAEGAAVRPRSLYLLNAMEAVLSDLSRSCVVPAVAACSALAVTGKSSGTGEAILAHNFDYLPVIQPLYTLRESRPAGKLRSLEFTVAPLCGTVDGINEAGLCITNNYAFMTDAKHAAPTISMWIAEALGCCRTVPEAAELLAKSKRWGAGLLMLGDAEGRIASLEISSTRSALRSPSDDSDLLFHTNRVQMSEMIPVELDEGAVYSDRAPQALRDQRVHQSADVRSERLQARINVAQQLDTEQISHVMSDHGHHDRPSAETICMHSDYWYTTACLQLFPKQRKMRVAYDTACRARYEEFQL